VTARAAAAGAPAKPHLLQTQLALASRMLSAHGHDDFNQGQVSARLPRGETFWIKRAVRGFDQATPEDMIVCAVDPAVPASPDAPPELALHQAIYAARPDAGGIVHSHPVHGIVFGATDLTLAAISHEGSYFAGGVPRFELTSQTILDLPTAQAVAEALGDANALFLCNHGIVVVARTIRQAAVLAVMLERACEVQLLAESVRRPYRTSSNEDIAAKRRFIYSDVALRTYWDHAADAVRRRHPEALSWTRGE
jgi:L-fuculose-phosphate aldolase